MSVIEGCTCIESTKMDSGKGKLIEKKKKTYRQPEEKKEEMEKKSERRMVKVGEERERRVEGG